MPSGVGTSCPAEHYPNGRFVNKINGVVTRLHFGVFSYIALDKGNRGAKLRGCHMGTLGSHAPCTLHSAGLKADAKWRRAGLGTERQELWPSLSPTAHLAVSWGHPKVLPGDWLGLGNLG